MSDALSKFDFSKVIKTGSYLKFVPGEPVTMRILTTDPIIFSASFEDKRTGEEIVTTKFAWIIYNFTGEVAQVMETTPNLAKKIGELHKDPDFGEDIKKLTINMFSDEKLLLKNKINYIKPANKFFSSFLIEKRVDIGLMEKDDFCKVNSGDFLLFDCLIMKGSLEINENSNYGFDNLANPKLRISQISS